MPDSSLTLEMLVKEGKAIIGLNRVAEAETKVVRGASDITKEAKKAEKALDDFAKRTTQINATPVEKYRAQLERLNAAFERGKISPDTYSRAIARANTELNSHKQTLSSAMLTRVAQFGAAYLTVGTALRLASGALREYTQLQRDAGASMDKTEDARRGLAQLALGMPKGTLEGWEQRSDAGAAAGGFSREAGLRTMFELQSFGQLDQYENVSRMGKAVDVEKAARLGTKVGRMFEGSVGIPELVNMSLEAGKPSEANFEQFADAAAAFMEGGGRIPGGSPEQMLALLGQTAAYYHRRGGFGGEGGGNSAGAVLMAGNRGKSFFSHVASERPDLLDKGDYLQIVDAILAMPEAEQREFVKSNIEVGGYLEVLKKSRGAAGAELGNISAARAATGTKGDNISQLIDIVEANPKLKATLSTRQATAAAEAKREGRFGLLEKGRERTLAQGESLAYDLGLSDWAITGMRAGGTIARGLGLSERNSAFAQGMGGLALSGGFSGADAKRDAGIWQWMGLMSAATEKTSAAADKLNAAATALLSAAQAHGESAGGSATRAIAAAAALPLN